MSDELPSSWTMAPLGEVANLQLGKMLDKARNVGALTLPYLRNINVRWGSFDMDDLSSMRFTPDEAEKFSVRDGDVMVCEGGEPGRAAVWRHGDTDIVFQKAIHRIRPSEALLPDWVALFLHHSADSGTLQDHFTGTTIKHLPGQALAKIEIPLPPLPEQRRIVARIEALFTRTRRARAELERIAPLAALHRKAALTVAATGALTGAWRDARPDLVNTQTALAAVRQGRQRERRLSGRHRVAATPDFDLPPSWEWVSPDELASDESYSIGIGPFGSNLVQGDYRPAGVRLIFVRDIRRERFDEKDARYVTPEKAAGLRPHAVMGGEVLITKMGDPPGDTAIFPRGIGPAVITSDCIKLQPDPRLGVSRYLAYVIRSQIVAAQIGEITKGVAQQKVSLDSFRRIALPAPPIAEQDEIANRLDTSLSASGKLEREATRALALLDRLEQSILTRAFRGELVPQDPRDEPATTLLARASAAATLQRIRRARRANPPQRCMSVGPGP